MDSKHVAMNMAMKELLPLQIIMIEICNNLNLDINQQTTNKSEVQEDNTGALRLAKLSPPRHTPQCKLHAPKYHRFREFVHLDKVGLNKIDTQLQLVDILTKSVPSGQFQILWGSF